MAAIQCVRLYLIAAGPWYVVLRSTLKSYFTRFSLIVHFSFEIFTCFLKKDFCRENLTTAGDPEVGSIGKSENKKVFENFIQSSYFLKEITTS